MTPKFYVLRIIALCLSLSLALSSGVYAEPGRSTLRETQPLEAGLEEELAQRFARPAAGLEERKAKIALGALLATLFGLNAMMPTGSPLVHRPASPPKPEIAEERLEGPSSTLIEQFQAIIRSALDASGKGDEESLKALRARAKALLANLEEDAIPPQLRHRFLEARIGLDNIKMNEPANLR